MAKCLLRLCETLKIDQNMNELESQVRIFRRMGNERTQLLQRFVLIMVRLHYLPEVGSRAHVIGLVLERTFEVCNSLIRSALFCKDCCNIVVCCWIVRFYLEDFLKHVNGFVVKVQLLQYDAEIVQTICPARTNLHRTLILLPGLIQFPFRLQ